MIYPRKIAMHPDRNDLFLARGELDGCPRWCYSPWNAQDVEGYAPMWFLKQAEKLGVDGNNLRIVTLKLEISDK